MLEENELQIHAQTFGMGVPYVLRLGPAGRSPLASPTSFACRSLKPAPLSMKDGVAVHPHYSHPAIMLNRARSARVEARTTLEHGMEGASVYILRCSDGSLYVGVTQREVEERLGEHISGLVPGYTCTRRPVELLFSEHYSRVTDAIAAEKRIKGWSRAKKVAYMRGDFDALHRFARSR